MSALEERQQRAREAFDDRWSGANDMFGSAGWAERLQQAREAAINTATRVRITPEIIEAATVAHDSNTFRIEAAIGAAFEAAGFEVEA